MSLDPVLTSAFVFLVLALGIYYWTTTKAAVSYEYRTLVVCWFLFALAAALFLYRFFPTSGAEGTLFGLSVGGAVAVFLVVWMLGPRWSTKAGEVDEWKAKAERLETEMEALRKAPGKREAIKLATGRILFKLTGKKDRTVGLAMGNLSSVKDIDLWVNSENTYMQMARFFEKNISGTIRYLGATRDKAEYVVDDVIGKALALEMGNTMMVQPGAVIETTSGALLKSHGVKQILHVAAVSAQYEAGFLQIENLGGCVHRVLDRACNQAGCRSILFPLMGAGTGRGNLNDTADTIVSAALSWLESSKDDGITAVYLLAWSDVERDAWKQALDKSGKVQPA